MLVEPVHWHPVLVHFTFALLFLAPLFMLVGTAGAGRAWAMPILGFGRGLLWTGVIITAFTIWAGFIAMWNVSVSEEVHHHIHSHRNWALGTATLFILLAIGSFLRWRKKSREGWGFILLLLVAFSMLLVTGYKGGELVFHHGVSVEATMSESNEGGSSGHSH